MTETHSQGLPTITTNSRRLRTGILCVVVAGTAAFCTDSTAAIDTGGPGGPGPAARIVKAAGDSQVGAPDTPVPVPPAVRVSDQDGNPVGGVHVLFTVTSGGGSVAGGDVTTGANGLAAVESWTLGKAKGMNVLTASAGEGLVVSFTTATAAEFTPDITRPSISHKRVPWSATHFTSP